MSTQPSQTTIICLTVADILARVYVDQPDGCYTLQQLEYHHKGNNAWQTKTNNNALKHVFDGFFLSKCVHVNFSVSIWMSIPVIPLSLTLYTTPVIISFILELFNLLCNGHSKSKSPKFRCTQRIHVYKIVHMDRIFGWTFSVFQMFLLLIKDEKRTRNVVDVLFAFNIRISSKPATILSGASSSLA